MSTRRLVVAVDGPSGAGKSTAARALARRLDYLFVDTGAMYRALTLKALTRKLHRDDGAALASLLRDTRIELREPGPRVLLDGEDVTSRIRSREVSRATSLVSRHSDVRREMVARQQELGRMGGVVLDGRDIGSAVFPRADVKFYLDANPRERAARRHRELAASDDQVDPEDVEREILERDHTDATRPDSPLVRSPDAVCIDTTRLSPDEVVERMLRVVRERGGGFTAADAATPDRACD